MSKVSQIRTGIHRITDEGEALEVAHRMAARFKTGAAERDRERELPHQELDELAMSGLLAITVPEEFGGIDVSNSVLAEVMAILSEADSSIGQVPQGHFYILEALRLDGSEAQKAFFYERVLAGDKFGNASSETCTQTVGYHNTTLTPDGRDYRINGRKLYSTGVPFADWIVIFANDPEDTLTMSFVPKGAEGIEIAYDWDGFGQRTTCSGTTNFDNVPVSASSVVWHHKGFERPGTIGSVGQIIHAAVDLGIARAALAETIEFARTRARPWMDSGVERASDDPLTISKVGEIAIRIEAAAALLDSAGRKIDTAQLSTTEANAIGASLTVAAAKVLTTEVAIYATNVLLEFAGTSSVPSGLNLDRHWRNARTHTLHNPVRWKFHAIGNYHVNGIAPARNGAF